MNGEKRLIIQKMFFRQKSQLRFIENYYTEKIGREIRITLDNNSQTSGFSPNSGTVFVATSNLLEYYNHEPKMFYTLFYTIILHEVGHAIYTGNLPYSFTMNILEDVRLEYHIEKWNTRVRFELKNYIMQDKRLTFESLKNHYGNIGLALFKTVNNKKYVKYLSKTKEGARLVNRALYLGNEYKNKDYRLGADVLKLDELKCINELEKITKEIEEILKELHQLIKTPKPKTPEIESNEEDETCDGESEDNAPDNNEPEEETDDNEEETDDNNDEPEEEDIEEDDEEDNELNDDDSCEFELEMEINDMEREGEKLENDIDDGIGLLHNPKKDTTPYDKHNVSVFTTQRRSGIKGKGTVQRHTGSAKQLAMNRYMRRNHVQGEKLFNKNTNHGSGGKTASVVFYIDISGSMSHNNRFINTINYVKSFYDTMNRYMNIRMFAFGRYTYQLGRDQLNHDYLRFEKGLESATMPKAIPLRPHEEIIFITDGSFSTDLPKDFLRKANFVLLHPTEHLEEFFHERASNVYTIYRGEDFFTGFEKATAGIKKMLQGRK